jgi:predicted O-methyltransferase YrrM
MMRNLALQMAMAGYFLRYLILGKHYRGHGIHSPFVFEFVNKVLFDKTYYSEYKKFTSVFSALKHSDQKLPVTDLGDCSKHFADKFRTVQDLLKVSSVSPKYGKLLFRIARHYKPAAIIELGTSIGISSFCLALGNPASKILTIEGNRSLCDFSQVLFENLTIRNVCIVQGNFDEVLADLPAEFSSPQLVFIDGNHQYEPTWHYYAHFSRSMNEGILIIDDIYWSAGMRRAWKEIVKQNTKYVTIDLFRMGIILIRKSLTSGHFTVRF